MVLICLPANIVIVLPIAVLVVFTNSLTNKKETELMSTTAVLIIRRAPALPDEEDPDSDFLWTDRHPDCEWAGIQRANHPDGVPAETLPYLINPSLPILLHAGQLIVPPKTISDELWLPVFHRLLDLYRGGGFLAVLQCGYV